MIRIRTLLGWAAASIAIATAGCTTSTSEPSAGLPFPETLPSIFAFSPPATRFTRTDHRTGEMTAKGDHARRADDQTLTWAVHVDRSGDGFLITHDLVHATMIRDGKKLVDGALSPGAVSVQLVVDRTGSVTQVLGSDRSAEVVESIAAPDAKSFVARAFSPRALESLVTLRHNILAGDIDGRNAAPGTTWTTRGAHGSAIASRTVKVERVGRCDGATCEELRQTLTIDPTVVADAALAFVQEKGLANGGGATVANASYTIDGTELIEPRTMVVHRATMRDHGTARVKVGGRDLDVEERGMTEYTVDLTPPSVALAH